uniref:Uncharacterized protein n=1 Tax=Vespula pensylvanica TaxID=30213 RepID=A0A834NYH1_VESPE|nr:hypothetical protein H0235_009432 [Vespula pensylvanica]
MCRVAKSKLWNAALMVYKRILPTKGATPLDGSSRRFKDPPSRASEAFPAAAISLLSQHKTLREESPLRPELQRNENFSSKIFQLVFSATVILKDDAIPWIVTVEVILGTVQRSHIVDKRLVISSKRGLHWNERIS